MKALAEYFERKTRDNGETFYSLTDDRPDWLQDAVRDAHEDEFPNDWRYDICHSIACDIEDMTEDNLFEYADGMTDTHTRDLVAWLDGGNRLALVDEIADECGMKDADTESKITYAQCVTIERMARIMLDAYTENVTDVDDEDDDTCTNCGDTGGSTVGLFCGACGLEGAEPADD